MKHLSNYTFGELKTLLIELPFDVIQIVYDYYHRDKRFTVEVFATNKGISTATLYRYIHKVELELKRHKH